MYATTLISTFHIHNTGSAHLNITQLTYPAISHAVNYPDKQANTVVGEVTLCVDCDSR